MAKIEQGTIPVDGWWLALIGFPSINFHDVGVEAGDEKEYSTILERTNLIQFPSINLLQ